MPEILHNPNRNPDIGPEFMEAGNIADPSTNLANRLIDHVNQGAVPLETSLVDLDPYDVDRVFEAILENPDSAIADSMEAQLRLSAERADRNSAISKTKVSRKENNSSK